jgi:hypothetical protein
MDNPRMKAQLGINSIGPVALSVGVAVIIVAVVALILATMQGASTDGNFTNVVSLGLTALTSFADWFGIIVIVVVAVIILSLVMMLRGRGGEG